MKIGNIELLNCDNMAFMATVPDKHFDLAIVDPEYGINAGKKKQYHDRAFTTYKAKNWDLKRPSEEYFKELFRVSKNQIIWGGNYFSDLLPPAKNWIVWDKAQPPGISFSMHELAFNSCDVQAMIFRVTNGENGNRCVVPDLAEEYKRIHPTQKPVKLYKNCLKYFAKEGDKILDTHGGSMSLGIACIEYKFEAVICEIDKDYFDAAIKRLQNYISQTVLF